MKEANQLTIYFDASCKLCDSEMQNIKSRDIEDRLTLIDCSAPEFDDRPFLVEGITRELMMNCLHARNGQGEWIKGVAAIEVIYRSVGMASIAKLWGHPLTRPLAERAYPWVVRHRYFLSRIGLHKLFNVWSRYAAHRAEKRSRQCREGNCSITH